MPPFAQVTVTLAVLTEVNVTVLVLGATMKVVVVGKSTKAVAVELLPRAWTEEK